MSITEYRRKRDFRTSPEPEGRDSAEGSSGPPRFTVQEHDASRLHYDLRLEIDGVFASWAVPKGPSLDPSDRRLAVQVEDHPLSYGDFEGVIPSGYGAGTVLLWDQGSCEFHDDPARGLARGRLSFTLHGRKLRGDWTLVRMKGEERNWLLLKQHDEEASTDGSVLREHPRSVSSGRT
ncbi:MAG TPA: DNA polymerase ligase N-terminal domain-containing protein, partial [Myxococcota bacterium]|nr:DNA polymerase ligase N-terminal domain-containing protein [Myxococcota bacterium]